MSDYSTECRGCKVEVEIIVEGYIGIIKDVWCEDCGYGGENR